REWAAQAAAPCPPQTDATHRAGLADACPTAARRVPGLAQACPTRARRVAGLARACLTHAHRVDLAHACLASCRARAEGKLLTCAIYPLSRHYKNLSCRR